MNKYMYLTLLAFVSGQVFGGNTPRTGLAQKRTLAVAQNEPTVSADNVQTMPGKKTIVIDALPENTSNVVQLELKKQISKDIHNTLSNISSRYKNQVSMLNQTGVIPQNQIGRFHIANDNQSEWNYCYIYTQNVKKPNGRKIPVLLGKYNKPQYLWDLYIAMNGIAQNYKELKLSATNKIGSLQANQQVIAEFVNPNYQAMPGSGQKCQLILTVPQCNQEVASTQASNVPNRVAYH